METRGLIFDGSTLLWEAMDKSRQQIPDAPKIDWFQLSTLHEAAAAIHLRVFGVASEHAAAGNTLLREINNRVVQGLDRQFVIFLPDAFLGLAETGSKAEILKGWDGTMILDFSHPYSEKSPPGTFQANAEAIWQNMSFKTLVDNNVPAEVVKVMRKSHPDLFKQSPWLSRGAFFIDGIVSALMAVQIHALNQSSIANAMRHTKMFNASSGDGEHDSNFRHPQFALRQIQQANLVTIGSFQPNLNLSKAPILLRRSDPQISNEFHNGLPSIHKPTLKLGFCGNILDEMLGGQTLTYPAVVALAKETMGTGNAFMDELKQLPYHISWHWGFTGSAHGELDAGLSLLSHSGSDANRPPLDFLIGCTSDQVSLDAAALATAKGVIQIAPYAFTSRLSHRDHFPFVFRTTPTSRDYAEGIVAMMQYFGWTGIGVINDRKLRGQALSDSLESVCQTSGISVRTFCVHSDPPEPADGIGCSPIITSFLAPALRSWESKLRIFALAVHDDMFPLMVKAILQTKRHDSVFVVDNLAAGMRGLATDARLALQGWLSLEHPQDGHSQVGSYFQKAWFSMGRASLAKQHLPDGIVQQLKGRAPQVYGTSPFRINTAQVLDAIIAALLAAKDSVPSVATGDFQRKQLVEAMNRISFDGASGHISFLPNINGSGGDLASAALTIRQMQKGQLVRLGTLKRSSTDQRIRTWRIHLHETPALPTGLGDHVETSGQGRNYNTVQFHASRHGHQEQGRLAHEGINSGTIKILIGVAVVLIVCISVPSRHEFTGWARTLVLDTRHPSEPLQHGQEAHHLRISHHGEEEVVGEATE